MQRNGEVDRKLVDAFIKYLNCPCQYFNPMADDEPIMEAYRAAKERGKKDGFVPVMVTVEDTLWECLTENSAPNSGGDEVHADTVKEYRKAALAAPLRPGKEVLHSRLELNMGAAEEELDLYKVILEEFGDGEAQNCFLGYWDYGSRKTVPLILAEIPVSNPWEIFAWLPFGGWNDCPDTPDLMAVSKYWYEQHGAAPAVITHDVLEYALPAPVSKEAAIELALEQYIWCSDIVDQSESGSVGMLADTLTQSDYWYFWWD